MKEYYVRFNGETKKVDVFLRENDSCIGSVSVTNGIVNWSELDEVLDRMTSIELKRDDLDYEIFYEERYWREYEEECMKEESI